MSRRSISHFIHALGRRVYHLERRLKIQGTPARALSNGHLETFELLELIKAEGVIPSVIFDVGGHVGTWSLLARAVFPEAQIHIFEPIAEHSATIKRNLSGLNNIQIHDYALGNSDGQDEINVATHSDSSSMLNLAENMQKYFGQQKTGVETIRMKRAIEIIGPRGINPPDIAKLDVQGYEIEVLKGFAEKLNSIRYLIIEVSFIEFYTGQPLFAEIISFLNEKGFRIHALGRSTPVAKALVQTDVLFKRHI